MIEQSGRVSRVEGDRVWVTCRPATCRACMEGRGCGAGVFAALLSRRDSNVEAVQGVSARPGDCVVLGLDERQLLGAAWRLYGIPLTGLIAGALAGALSGGAENDGAVLVGGLAGLGLAILAQRRRADRLPRPVILRRVAAGE